MALNSKNFIRWIDTSVKTELTTDGDFNNCSGGDLLDWDMNVTSPVGQNEDDWTCNGSLIDIDTPAGDWSKGVSQAMSIKAGNVYYIDTVAASPFSDADFYILFVDEDDNYQDAKVIPLTTSNVEYKFFAIADGNYSKVMLVTNNTGVGTFTTPIASFKIYEFSSDLADCFYALPLVAGDELTIWVNGQLDDTSISFSGLQVDLINQEGLYLGNIATLNQIVISGDIYQFYFTWTVPTLPKGNYRFVINDGTDDLYVSNQLTTKSSTNYTKVVKYKNTKNALGYYYESAPSIYTQLRIDIWKGLPVFPNQRTGYQTYQGVFIPVKSSVQKGIEFETRFFDEVAHDGFANMILHDEFYIDDIRYKLPEDQSYEINWSEDDDNRIGNGTVRLNESSYSTEINQC